MRISRAGKFSRPAAGFTLLEVLVVLVIVGVSLFALMPALSPKEQDADGFEAFLAAARSDAIRKGRTQRICFTYGDTTLRRGDSSVELDAPVASVSLDAEPVPAPGGCFHCYPSGLMDSITLRLASGLTYRSVMLTSRLEAHDDTRQLLPAQ